MAKPLFTFFSLFLVGHIIAQQKTEFKFSVSSLDKSLFFDRSTYYVSPKILVIKDGSDIDFSFGKKLEKAKVVFQVKLDSSEMTRFYGLTSIFENDSLKSRYANLCIMDGLILDFNFNLGSKKKTLSLSNYYVSQMQPFVDFVNMKVPKKYKIWYDRLDLKKLMEKCPDWKLLEY